MPSIHASVLIPVKNGGHLLGAVLDAVLAQKTSWPFEVLVMDSGSTDGSVELVRSRGVRCETIPPEQFGHGRTRNQLAEMAQGHFLVFITQDAKPANLDWLQQLVSGCDVSPDVAGAFGPHLAYPTARPVTQRELATHFNGFGATLTVVRLDDAARFEADPGYRQYLHFFTSNNACIRKSTWAAIPLPDVVFAEDQTWALQAIKAGYAKAYVPSAAVYHSHDFGVWETMQRNFDESRCFARYFGYRLQVSLPHAIASVAYLTRRDVSWLKEIGLGGLKLLGASANMMLIEIARVAGQYLGTRHAALPSFVSRAISRDETLQRTGTV